MINKIEIINQLNTVGILENQIKYIFKTGSYAFIQDYNDYDFLVITNEEYLDKKTIHFQYEGKKVDVFIETYEILKQTLSYEKRTRLSNFILLFIKHDLTLIHGVWEEDYNFLETKEQYIESLKENINPVYYKNYSYVVWKENNIPYYLPKTFFWIYIPIQMIKNMSTDITKEMITLIEDSHNMLLDLSLKEEIRNFLDLEDETEPIKFEKDDDTVIWSIELENIRQWLLDNDYKINKHTLGEYSDNDERWTSYLAERQLKLSRYNELENLINH